MLTEPESTASLTTAVVPPPDTTGSGMFLECPCCSSTLVIRQPRVRVARPPAHTPAVVKLAPTPSLDQGLEAVVRHVEVELVELALRETEGVKLHAAQLLGLKYSTFWELADRRGVEIDAGAAAPDASLEEVERIEVIVPIPGDGPLVLSLTGDGEDGLLRTVVRGCRRELAERALEETGGNLSRAASRLGVPYTTFHHMVRRLDVGKKERRAATGMPGTGARGDDRDDDRESEHAG